MYLPARPLTPAVPGSPVQVAACASTLCRGLGAPRPASWALLPPLTPWARGPAPLSGSQSSRSRGGLPQTRPTTAVSSAVPGRFCQAERLSLTLSVERSFHLSQSSMGCLTGSLGMGQARPESMPASCQDTPPSPFHWPLSPENVLSHGCPCL